MGGRALKKTGNIETIARAVCVHAGKVLLCHSKGAVNTFLPGGHVEFGESAESALCREMQEELGVGCAIARFLGAVEHAFVQEGRKHHEINLVFEVRLTDVDSTSAPKSLEAQIEFLWVPMTGLADSSLEPATLRSLLPEWTVGGCGGMGVWSSTLGR